MTCLNDTSQEQCGSVEPQWDFQLHLSETLMYKGIFNDFSHGCLHVCACRCVKQNNIMNEKEFFDLVVKMRTAQKNYFATRRRRGLVPESELRNLLLASKILEKELDSEIERVFEEQREAIEPKLNFESDV